MYVRLGEINIKKLSKKEIMKIVFFDVVFSWVVGYRFNCFGGKCWSREIVMYEWKMCISFLLVYGFILMVNIFMNLMLKILVSYF